MSQTIYQLNFKNASVFFRLLKNFLADDRQS